MSRPLADPQLHFLRPSHRDCTSLDGRSTLSREVQYFETVQSTRGMSVGRCIVVGGRFYNHFAQRLIFGVEEGAR